VECLGNETDIALCPHNGWGVHNCYHSEDVYILCFLPSIPQFIPGKTHTDTLYRFTHLIFSSFLSFCLRFFLSYLLNRQTQNSLEIATVTCNYRVLWFMTHCYNKSIELTSDDPDFWISTHCSVQVYSRPLVHIMRVAPWGQ